MSQRLGRTACRLAAAALLVGCAETPNAPESGLAGDGGAPAFMATAAGQTQGVLDLIDAQSDAWAAKDATAYAATYTQDAEVINPVGGILAGRAVIEAQHAFLFNPVNGFFRVSTSTWSLRDLTFLTGTIAHVKLDVTLTDISTVPPGLPQVQPGVVRTRVTWVAVKQGANWLIQHQQMTPLPPAM